LKSSKGIETAFTQDYYGQANPQYALDYRPLSILTHWLDWQIWKTNAFGHHLSNLLIHLCGLLLYFLLNRLLEMIPFFVVGFVFIESRQHRDIYFRPRGCARDFFRC
jgi:hypothetical protein